MIKTFGKVFLEVDRYAGLRLGCEDGTSHNIRGWDERGKISPIHGTLMSTDPAEAPLWEGELFTRGQVHAVFQSTNPDGSPVTFATRKGRAGRARRGGIIRVASRDGKSFELPRCNGGEEVQDVLHCGQLAPEIVLQVFAARHSLQSLVFDAVSHNSRVKRLLELE